MLLTILCCFHASLNDCCQCDRFPSCFWTHWGQSHNYGFKKISALPYLLSMLISTYAFVPLMNFPISILYLNNDENVPKIFKIYQSMYKIMPNTKWTLSKWPKLFNYMPKWRNFTKFDHTAEHQIHWKNKFLLLSNLPFRYKVGFYLLQPLF